MKTNLVILVDILPDIKGGAERQIYEFLKHHDRNLFDITIVVVHQDDLPIEIKDLPVHYRCLNIKRIYDLDGIKKGFEFKKLLTKKKTDILMTYHFAADIWGTIFGKMAKVPLIISNRRDVGFWRGKNHIKAYKIVNKWVNKIIVVSQAVKNAVINEEKVYSDKVEVFYNGVDLTRFKKTFDIKAKKLELSLPLDAKIIGAVGNLRPIKGHKYLIEAAAQVIQQHPNTHFLFIGDGELKLEFKELAHKLGIEENIHLLGKRMDVPELLSIMDICVLPSLSEGLSNTLLEYMAARKPIIATSVGGNPEVIKDNIDGLLVEKANSQALAQSIIKLLGNNSLALKLALEAKNKVIEQFDLSKQLKKVEDFLLQESRSTKGVRVLHLISSNGLFGAEKVMLNLAGEMQNQEIKSFVCAVKNTYNPHLEVIDEAKKLNIPVFTVESKSQFDNCTVKELVSIIRENKINLIHTHNFKSNFLGLLAARKAKVRIVATLHGYINSGFKVKVYEYIDRFLVKYFSKVIFVDKSLFKWFNSKNSKYQVIKNCIYKESNLLNQLTYSKNNSELIIGSVGRLSSEKGYEYLIKAFAKLTKKYNNIKLILVGSGELQDKLSCLVNDLKIEKEVKFTGFKNNVAQYYQQFDIYVCSSLVEHLPLTILEAMSFGKAIIATDVGGVGDLIKNDYTGLLIESGRCDKLEESIEKLILDGELRKKLGQQAQDFVKTNCAIEQMTSKYLQVYKEVLKS